ncbi:nSTAND1 domain-containing NTPase [Calothrix sp. NIES-2098]|uniref:WD40 domain-containing protein n=1 Tax=Calothrix sp. NIES-2098 TaxID=1954171 RepID=UPI000B62076C|nr:WD-40 repeat-containing protein [Calothrix sp. NIES-2098]
MQINNDRTLQQLAWAIEASVGQFKLILARCNYTNLRDRLIDQLKAICRVEISILAVQQNNKTLYSAIREEFGEQLPACLMVVGLDLVQDLPQMLTSANQVREEFRKHFPFPLVLWINDDVHKQLMQIAPDLESWAITRSFAISKQDLVTFLQQTADNWFSNRLTLNLSAYLQLEAELKAAQRDLLGDEQFNSLEIQADIASLLGLIAQVNRQIDSAIEHYQTALALWQQAKNLERQVKILGNLALCYYLKAAKYIDINNSNWQNTQKYLQQYIDLLTQAQNPNLIADSIGQLGEILRDIRIWQQFQNLTEQLKSFAQQALTIHQANNQARELAKDYGFLAEVALVQKSWQEANNFIQQALQIWSAIPSVESGLLSELPENFISANDFSLYQFILALSQYHLGQTQEAIASLESAKDNANPAKDLKLYLNILNYLQRLYFEQQEYLQAYEMKQQQRSVEQQFGLRAFIGAGRLGSTKQVIEETVQATSLQENIAPEIAASGRQLDVERLLERIGRPDCKLIVIYGQSGVGKSSLINAGLIPALKQKAIGIQDNLPVVMRFYTNWEEELGRVLLDEGQGAGGREQGELRSDSSGFLPDSLGSEGDNSSFLPDSSSSEGDNSSSEHDSPSFLLDTPSSEHENPSFLLDISSSEGDSSSFLLDTPSSEHDSPSFLLGTSSSERDNSSFLLDTPSSEGDNPSFLLNTPSSEPNSPSSEPPLLPLRPAPYALPLALLAQLRDNEAKNLRTVLIFDQFEEFFFTYPEPSQRRQFFEFLGECFHVLSVKVILSLRVDYLHYLLECNDIANMQIIGNDILSKNVLYKLGNFSPTDAKSIIQRLTENTSFRLEPTLVDQLVQDLASELGEVRPIELQVVGAQLQTENITTLAEYRQRGTKEQLVKQYLDEVVRDCGAENQQLADLLLYLLTDEKGTRPLRTLVELERDLQALVKEQKQTRKQRNRRIWRRRSKKLNKETSSFAKELPISQKLELVLAIFVKSGLVVLLKENPAERYQLVHDYLAAFIRQQQEPKLKELMAELEKERTQRKLGEEKLNRLLKIALFVSIAAGLGFAGLAAVTWRWAIEANKQKKQAEISDINAFANSSATFSASGQTRNAIIEALKAVEKLNKLKQPLADTQVHVVGSLREAVYLQPKENQFQELNTLSGHNSPIFSIAFSPDKQRLASGSGDNTINLWDITTGKLLQTFPLEQYSDSGHSSTVNSIAFSPDRQKLASGSDDSTIKLWDVTTGKLQRTINGHTLPVNSIAFSSDGKLLASGSTDKTVRLWDVTTGKLLQTLRGHSNKVNSIAFNRDRQRLASGSDDKTIKLWDVETGKLLQTIKGHTLPVNSIVFSPDGKQLASASDDNTIKLWNVNTGKLLQTLRGHSSRFNSIAFSLDGKQLAAGSDDKTIKLWDVSSGKLLQILRGHSNTVSSIAFSPDGKQLASGSRDQTIKLWNITIGQKLEILSALKTLSSHSDSVYNVAFSADGQRLAFGSDRNTIKLWDVTNSKLLQTIAAQPYVNTSYSPEVISVAFSPDGQKLAFGSNDNTIKLLDVATKKQLQSISGHRSPVYSLAFSPDGQKLASGSADNTIKIWDANTGQEMHTLSGHSSWVYSIAFSPDGQKLASGSADNTIKLWDVNIGKELQTLSGHSSTVYSVAFSPDGQRLASSSDDNTIKLWNADTGKELQTLSGHSSAVRSVAFSADGQSLISKSLDNTVIVWNFNLKDLVNDGCNLIKNYLIVHPETLAEIESCQTPSVLVQAATVLVLQGEKLAKLGDKDGAVAKFRQAKQWDTSLRFNPVAKAEELAGKEK